MKLYYLENRETWQVRNRAGKDYTPAYLREMLFSIGAKGAPWTPGDLIGKDDILLVGAERVPDLPDCRKILFGTNDPGGQEAVRNSGITDAYVTADGRHLPLFAPLLEAFTGWQVLRWTAGRKPALTRHGDVFRFCFDLPASLWYSGDGIYTGHSLSGFSIGRVPDSRPLPDTTAGTLPYNDCLLEEVESILLGWGVPLLYRLPPLEGGEIPDFALHFSGDDDCTSAEYNLNAAKIMHQAGFPYHINAMPLGGKHFIFDGSFLKKLNSLGVEVALHTDFINDSGVIGGVPYTIESQKAQADLFEKTFRYRPLTNSNHYFAQDGPACERLRWLSACGIIGDNSKFGEINVSDIGTGEMNAFNLSGFSFGTTFPRYTIDDAEHGNRDIDTMEIPINYYEPRLGGPYTDSGRITGYLDQAAGAGRIAQFFIHPHYFQPDNPDSVFVANVLALVSDHIARKGYRVLRTTTDRIASFWRGRRSSEIAESRDGTISVQADVPLIVSIPEGACTEQVLVNGKRSETVLRKTGAGKIRLVVLPCPGAFRIQML